MTDQPDVVLGPVICHFCHAPALYRRTSGWCQRNYVLRGQRLVPVFVPHRCTARPGQPMYEFKRG